MTAPKIYSYKVSGNSYEIGFAIGRAMRYQLAHAVDNYRAVLTTEGWEGPWVLPGDYLEAAGNAFPHLVEELQGLATGAGLAFSDLFFLNALEEALELKQRSACTSIGIVGPDGAWLGHNEDWYAGDAETVLALKVKPRGKPAFITVTAAPFLAAVGMNEAGLVQGINSVSSTDGRVGVPRMFAARAALEAESVGEAKVLAAPDGRAGGYNHLLLHRSGEMGNYETTATEADYLPGRNVLFHTNHYLSPRLSALAEEASKRSLARYRRLEALFDTTATCPVDHNILQRALQDHENRPLSICKHAEEGQDGEGTIFSVIFDPSSFKVFGVAGNPCRGGYQEIKF